MTDVVYVSKRWWITPLLFVIALITGLVIACNVSETAREVILKAFMTLAGALSTPFILESSVAIFGLAIVVAINQWRLQQEGDGWVYLAQTEPDAASISTGAETPPKRLEGVILANPPDLETDFDSRLAIAEGYLELGLNEEALEHLKLLSDEEQKHPRAIALQARSGGL